MIMKKNYIAPSVELIDVKLLSMLADSDPTHSGQVDHGENTPGSRHRGSVWGDEEDDWD